MTNKDSAATLAPTSIGFAVVFEVNEFANDTHDEQAQRSKVE